MLKKSAVILISVLLLFMCACSKESKFGLSEFTERMNNSYGTNFETASFLLGAREDGSECFFSETETGLICIFPDSNSTIKGISAMETESGNINELITLYLQMCCVFTGTEENEVQSILKNCEITAEEIKFADSCSVNTVGKYKYTVVCNRYAVTLFCERV